MKPSLETVLRGGRAALGAALLLGATLLVTACTVYEPVPAYQPSSFDRSWSAAVGALQDQGLRIVEQDRASGVVRATRGAIGTTALVRTQPDGRVRVEFKTTGAADADPGLATRITESYQRRMGR